MSLPSLTPIILAAERQPGGQLHARVRLSSGHVAEVILPAGELTDALLAELDAALLAGLGPGRSFTA